MVFELCVQLLGHEDLVLYLLLPLEFYLATLVNELLSKNDLTQAMDVICSLYSSEIQQIKGIYPSLFGREIEDDIENFMFEEHRKLLLEYISIASAPEQNDLRAEMLRDECCEEIFRSLNKNVIETFKCPRVAIGNCVFGLREEHMRAVVDGYHKKYGRPLEKDLTLANYGHVEHAIVTKIKCAVNCPGYHAEKLCEAMIDRYTRAMRDIDQIDREAIVRVIRTGG